MEDIELPPLPERDTSKPAEQQGVFRKFDVRRTDGSSEPGGKHHGCEYFVLDAVCDDDLSELAHSANQEALSFGLSHDVFMRYFKEVRRRMLASTPAPAQGAQRVPDGWLSALEDFEKKERSPFQAYLAAGLANELRAAMLASTPAPAQQEPMEAFLVIDLSRELGVAASELIKELRDQGIGDYSVNMALPKSAAAAMRAHFKSAAQRQEPPQQERGPMTDEEIDRVLSTVIPGGSTARDWFLPHDTERGLKNVRDVVRRMFERHHGIKE